MKKLKRTPEFKSEDETAAFWNSHDSTGIIDWSKAKRVVFPELKPTTKAVSLRLPQWMIERYKTLARKKDVPYQSLMKISLAEALKRLS